MSFNTARKTGLSNEELLSIAGGEIRLLKGQLATFQLREMAFGPITRFIIKHFSKF